MRAVRYYTEVMEDRAEDLAAVLDILNDVGVADRVLIGGLAVGHHWRPRATVDVDMLVPGRALKPVTAEARRHDYDVRSFPGMIRIYAPSSREESIADLVSADAHPVLRAAFRETEDVELLGQDVSVVNRGALVALKFHSSASPDRAPLDRQQDVIDIGRVIEKRFDARDEATARRIAALSYPGAAADFDALVADLRAGRPVQI